jgi:Fur family zinc uptake transcriptional regulator
MTRDGRKQQQRVPATFAAAEHDHAACVDHALNAAGEICGERGQRLTPLRRRVLELVWESHSPVGAYDLLDRLRAERDRVAPPTIYRALNFLCDQGLVHRVESLKAFIGCAYPKKSHLAQVLICRGCGQAAELADEALEGAVSAVARQAAFDVEDQAIELTGLCVDCQPA